VIFIDDLLRDLRYAGRAMRRSPGFTALAILIMALGIGANTAVFSVVNAVLLKPLAYRDPDRIVDLTERQSSSPTELGEPVSVPNFLDWHDQSSSFEAMAFYGSREIPVMSGAAAEYHRGTQVSVEFFSRLCRRADWLNVLQALRRVPGTSIHQSDTDVLVIHGAVGVVRLQGDGSSPDPAVWKICGTLPIGRLRPLRDRLAVDFYSHAHALNEDTFREPLVVFGHGRADVCYFVQTARKARVTRVSVVHLRFKSLARPALLLKLCMEIDAAVGLRTRLHIHSQFEVFEQVILKVAHVEAVASGAVGHDRTFGNGK